MSKADLNIFVPPPEAEHHDAMFGQAESNWEMVSYVPHEVQNKIERTFNKHSGHGGNAPKRAVVVAHRRAGKTYQTIKQLVEIAIASKLPHAKYAYIAPTIDRAKEIAWENIKDFLQDYPGARFYENLPEVRFDGKSIRLYGATRVNRMRGIHLDGVVLDEYGEFPPEIWDTTISPTLTNPGRPEGFAWFIGTAQGPNHFYKMFNLADDLGWGTGFYPATATGLFTPEWLDAKRKEMAIMHKFGDSGFRQEYLCDWNAAIVGSYYGELMDAMEQDGRVTDVPHDPTLPVIVGQDLGLDGEHVIICAQIRGSRVSIIDYIGERDQDYPFFVKWLLSKNYTYSVVGFPHDAKQRNPANKISKKNEFVNAGLPQHLPKIIERNPITDSRSAVRSLMPRMWIDKTKCERLVEALKLYQRSYDQSTGAFADHPKRGWEVHSADALANLALVLRKVSGYTRLKGDLTRLSSGPLDNLPPYKRGGVNHGGMI